MKEKYFNHGTILRYRSDINQFDKINIRSINISSGSDHALILDKNGDVWAFGNNQYGQLGLGNLIDRPNPTKVNLPVKIIYVACGAYHSMVIDENNEVWAFGKNSSGQLGLGDQIDRNVPTKYDENDLYLNFIKISCGNKHSLFLTDQKSVAACGDLSFGGIHELLLRPNYFISDPVNDIAAGENQAMIITNKAFSSVNVKILLPNPYSERGVSFESLRNIFIDCIIVQAAVDKNYTIFLDENGNIWSFENGHYSLPIQLKRRKIEIHTKIISVFRGPSSAFLIDINNDLWMIDNINNVSKVNILDHKVKSIAANDNGFLAIILY